MLYNRSGVGEGSSPRGSHRAVLWVSLLLVTAHTLMIVAWAAPPNLLRDKLGQDRVRNYALPIFDQSWSIFAPEADYTYHLFEIRAVVNTAGRSEIQTDWIPVTENEVAPTILWNPFPARTALVSTRLAGDAQSRFNKLSAAQQDVFGNADREVHLAELGRQLRAAASNEDERAAGSRFVRIESAVERYLGAIAQVVWGDGVVAVQYRTYTLKVPSYSASVPERQVRTDYKLTSTFRPVVISDEVERAVFTDYVQELGIRAAS